MKAELFNYKCWISISEPDEVKAFGADLLQKTDFEILGFVEHHFQPFGYTCIWLLAESHLAIHTFPEESKTYLELTSCVEQKRVAFENLVLGSDHFLIAQG